MTTMNLSDISHKRRVTSKYQPNSYRIFCEEISNESIPEKYINTAPDLYSQPPILPAQAIEERNRPHGGRGASFLRENVRTLNEPVNAIHNIKAMAKDDKKWWEWNTPTEDADPMWKNKKRSQSTSHLNREPVTDSSSGYQTTYQKEHGYLKGQLQRPGNSDNNANRHAYNPNNAQAVGIVPVTELKGYNDVNRERVYVDKMSFEHQYDSREPSNYPVKGKRQGAFVLDQYEPKHQLGTKQHSDMNKGTSVWDCMHHTDEVVGNPEPKAQVYQKPFSGKPGSSNQRRDPIGYYEETNKYTDNANGGMVPKSASKQYTPSWSNGYAKEEQSNGYAKEEQSNGYAKEEQSNGYAKDQQSMGGSKMNYGKDLAHMNNIDYVNSNELLDQAMMTTNGQFKEQTVGGY